MKTAIIGVSAVVLMLILMYYRKKHKLNKELEIEEMKKPQINVVPENVTSKLIEQLENLSKVYETKIEPKTKKFRIMISSAERNTTAYPNVTQYQLKLPTPIYSLDKIKLVKATLPTSLNLINSNNNQLILSGTFTFGGVALSFDYTATLTVGNYTASQLATMIQEELNTAAAGDGRFTTKAEFDFSINSNTYIASVSTDVYPVYLGTTATAAKLNFNSSGLYIKSLLGYVPDQTGTDPFVGVEPVNTLYNQTILLDLDNRSYDFNSLRIMAKDNDDLRTFACLTMPSGNGLAAGGAGTNGVPSAMTVSGAKVLVEGNASLAGSSAGGYGNYVITKDSTNAYYKAYEGPIPSTEYINVRLRQLLPDGTLGTPDFNNVDHSLEFEIKAQVDKISLTNK